MKLLSKAAEAYLLANFADFGSLLPKFHEIFPIWLRGKKLFRGPHEYPLGGDYEVNIFQKSTT